MSTPTVARPAPAPRTLHAHWRRSFDLTMGMCLYVSKWFLLIMLVLAAAATLIYRSFDTPEVSIVQFGQQAALWFPFSMMIMCGAMTPTLVMNGLTRSGVALGSLMTALGMAATFALGLVGLLVVEAQVFDALGWSAAVLDGDDQLPTGRYGAYLLALFLIYCAGNVSGLLVHASYYRLGGLFGTVALPLTLAPLALVGIVGTSPSAPWRPWGPGDAGPLARFIVDLDPWHPAIGLAVICLAALAYYRLTRTLTLAQKES